MKDVFWYLPWYRKETTFPKQKWITIFGIYLVRWGCSRCMNNIRTDNWRRHVRPTRYQVSIKLCAGIGDWLCVCVILMRVRTRGKYVSITRSSVQTPCMRVKSILEEWSLFCEDYVNKKHTKNYKPWKKHAAITNGNATTHGTVFRRRRLVFRVSCCVAFLQGHGCGRKLRTKQTNSAWYLKTVSKLLWTVNVGERF